MSPTRSLLAIALLAQACTAAPAAELELGDPPSLARAPEPDGGAPSTTPSPIPDPQDAPTAVASCASMSCDEGELCCPARGVCVPIGCADCCPVEDAMEPAPRTERVEVPPADGDPLPPPEPLPPEGPGPRPGEGGAGSGTPPVPGPSPE